jgi:hypothetical protein
MILGRRFLPKNEGSSLYMGISKKPPHPVKPIRRRGEVFEDGFGLQGCEQEGLSIAFLHTAQTSR